MVSPSQTMRTFSKLTFFPGSPARRGRSRVSSGLTLVWVPLISTIAYTEAPGSLVLDPSTESSLAATERGGVSAWSWSQRGFLSRLRGPGQAAINRLGRRSRSIGRPELAVLGRRPSVGFGLPPSSTTLKTSADLRGGECTAILAGKSYSSRTTLIPPRR